MSVIKDIEEFFTNVRLSVRPYRTFNRNGNIEAIQLINKDLNINAIEIIDKDHLIPAIDFYIKPDFTKIKEELKIE